MTQRSVVMAAAWLEILAGAGFTAVIDVVSRLLFASAPEGAGAVLGRFAGIVLFALGIACLPSTEGPRRSAILGLFVFNSGVALLFVWVGLATTLHGIFLWPATALHAVLAAVLLAQLLAKGSLAAKPKEIRIN